MTRYVYDKPPFTPHPKTHARLLHKGFLRTKLDRQIERKTDIPTERHTEHYNFNLIYLKLHYLQTLATILYEAAAEDLVDCRIVEDILGVPPETGSDINSNLQPPQNPEVSYRYLLLISTIILFISFVIGLYFKYS